MAVQVYLYMAYTTLYKTKPSTIFQLSCKLHLGETKTRQTLNVKTDWSAAFTMCTSHTVSTHSVKKVLKTVESWIMGNVPYCFRHRSRDDRHRLLPQLLLQRHPGVGLLLHVRVLHVRASVGDLRQLLEHSWLRHVRRSACTYCVLHDERVHVHNQRTCTREWGNMMSIFLINYF